MARLVIFLVFLLGLALIMNLNSGKSVKIADSKPFNYEMAKKDYEAKQKELDKLKNPPVVKKVVKVVKEGPLVELTTEELKRGAALYKKCIVCHGNRGQGKKSQNAPAVGGQYDWYLNTQIKNMRDGVRVNKVMMPYVRKLSNQDISDLSVYISKLPHMGKK